MSLGSVLWMKAEKNSEVVPEIERELMSVVYIRPLFCNKWLWKKELLSFLDASLLLLKPEY
jgi:hypothetical protein